jgi:hypothetical protein
MRTVTTNMSVNLSQASLCVNSNTSTFQLALRLRRNRKLMFIMRRNVIHTQRIAMEAPSMKIMITLILIHILSMMELIYLMRVMRAMSSTSMTTTTTTTK